MKEKSEPIADPILEECYRIKEELAAQFNSTQELYDYLKANQKKWKALGFKYLPPPSPKTKEGANERKT